jgi:large subunit ribosomal protein L29
MKASDIREKNDAELGELNRSLRDELFRLRMQLYTGQLDRPNRLREVRKSVARVETVLSERKA